MTASSLAAAERFTVLQEEGYQRVPLAGDPGGDTQYGITQARLSEWRGRPVAVADVYALTYEEAGAIFHGGYWNALRCDRLWPGLDLMAADHAFNAGVGASSRVLQRALGVAQDGRIGPITLGAVDAVPDRAAFLGHLRDVQRADYLAKADFPRFGDEWIGNPDGTTGWTRAGRLGRRWAAAAQLLKDHPAP